MPALPGIFVVTAYDVFNFTTADENGTGSHGERLLRAVGFSQVLQAHASRKQRGRRGYQGSIFIKVPHVLFELTTADESAH